MSSHPRSLLKEKRRLKVGVADPAYLDNSIKTSKYTFYNFIFINMFEQFKKPANVYFLCLSIMQVIKAISISNGQPTILIPLVFVISVSMLKDWIEDSKRSKADREENNSKVLVLRNGRFVEEKWAKIYAGEIVKVCNDQFIPADLLILATSNKKADCFVETKSLDGETNLKSKFVQPKIREVVHDEKTLHNVELADLYFEAPNPYIYKFSGTMNNKNVQIPLDIGNVALRSSRLKNTAFVIGAVIFTGHYTKIMMNSIKGKRKSSDIEDKVGILLILLFGVLVELVLIARSYCALYSLFCTFFGTRITKGRLATSTLPTSISWRNFS